MKLCRSRLATIIVSAATEHKAVLDSCKRLEKDGFQVTYLPVDKDGRVNPIAVGEAMTDKTILVSIMHANNEVGTIQPIRAIADIAHARGVLVHTDAAQTIGSVGRPALAAQTFRCRRVPSQSRAIG